MMYHLEFQETQLLQQLVHIQNINMEKHLELEEELQWR